MARVLAVVAEPRSPRAARGQARKSALQAGLAMPLIELRLIGDYCTEQPWAGKSMGEVQIRWPWVASTYNNDERASKQWHEGCLRTGHVGVIDSEGYLQLVDRGKDKTYTVFLSKHRRVNPGGYRAYFVRSGDGSCSLLDP